MKIAFQIEVRAPMEAVWKTLLDFGHYSEWNSLLPSVEGDPALDATLQVVVSPLGLNRRHIAAQVTGFMSPKYFSLESAHRFGAWFYREELVFRMKEKADGVEFFAEAFVTGLSLRFRRASVEGAFRRSLLRTAESLKERVEAEGAPEANPNPQAG